MSDAVAWNGTRGRVSRIKGIGADVCGGGIRDENHKFIRTVRFWRSAGLECRDRGRIERPRTVSDHYLLVAVQRGATSFGRKGDEFL